MPKPKKSQLDLNIAKSIRIDPFVVHARKFNEGDDDKIINSFYQVVAAATAIIDTDEIKKLPTDQRRAIRSIAEYRELPLPESPTKTVPGSMQRLKAYRERIARGEAIFHPNDTTLNGVVGGSIDRVVYSGFNNRRGKMLG
jgi:hypothetical protein